MHGNGNDFVVLDFRGAPEPFLPELDTLKNLADRQRGVGCDQVVVLLDSLHPHTLAHVRFFNHDGSESSACGNGARCVAWLLSKGVPLPAHITFSTRATHHQATVISQDQVSLSMGCGTLLPEEIPLAPGLDPKAIDVNIPELGAGFALGMGNPHVVFFVQNIETYDLGRLGPKIETHPAFPERVNVHLVEQIGPHEARQKTWERGAGLTLSCGSGACAVALAGQQKGYWQNTITLMQPGGPLTCDIAQEGQITLTGPVRRVFSGLWETPS